MGVARGRLLEQSPKVMGVGVEFASKIRQVGVGAPSQLPDPLLGRCFAWKVTESLGEPRLLLIRKSTTKMHFEPTEVLHVFTPAIAVQDTNRVTKARMLQVGGKVAKYVLPGTTTDHSDADPCSSRGRLNYQSFGNTVFDADDHLDFGKPHEVG